MNVGGKQSWLVFSLVVALTGVGCGRWSAATAKTSPVVAQAKQVIPGDEFVVGPGVTHGNLTVFPITSRSVRADDRLMTLDEGLAAGTVEVRELSASDAASGARPRGAAQNEEDPFGETEQLPRQRPEDDPFGKPATPEDPVKPEATVDPFGVQAIDEPMPESEAAPPVERASNDVNRVIVINNSDRPLYLMPGEIILGGDQDRAIGQELVIAPGGKPVEVEVYCIEHGRWGGKGEAVTYGQLHALASNLQIVVSPEDVAALKQKAAEADQGKFVASAGALSKKARVAAQHDKSQGKVWDEVAEANTKGNVNGASGAFTGQYVDEAARRLDPYLKALSPHVVDQPRVVGVVVAINGEVESFDVFESTPLFRKLWPKLLKSYAVDAANAVMDEPVEADGKEAIASAEQPAKKPRVCTQEDAARFVKEAIAADVTKCDSTGDLAIEQRDTEKVLLYSAHDRRTSEVGGESSGFGGGLGGFGGGVHGFGAAK